MKILWVTNIPLPEASLLLNKEPVPFGGWLVNAAANLAKENMIKLEVSFPIKGGDNVRTVQGKNILYYTFPSIGYQNKEKYKKKIYNI